MSLGLSYIYFEFVWGAWVLDTLLLLNGNPPAQALHNTLIELQTACKWYTENAPGWVRKKAPFPFPHFPSSPSVWYSAKTQKDARSIMSGLIAEVHVT